METKEFNKVSSEHFGVRSGTKFVTTKFINSLSFPLLIESLKIIFLEIKYEIITPREKENIFVR